MFRLIRLTLLLIVACTAAIFAAHLIGGTRPNPLAILFTNPDGTLCQRPCLLGVRPGATTYDQAEIIIKSHPLLQGLRVDSTKCGFQAVGGGIYVSARTDCQDQLVAEFDIRRLEDYFQNTTETPSGLFSYLGAISIGEVVTAFGSPEFITYQSYSSTQYLYLNYPDEHNMMIWGLYEVDAQRWTTTIPLIGIGLEAGPFSPKPLAWLGFASWKRYRILPQVP